MSQMTLDQHPSPVALPDARLQGAGRLPLTSQYLVSLLLTVAATLIAFVVEHLISAPNLTLIYVVPVVIAGAAFGWWPSLAAVFASVLAFDFFFTVPYFSFQIDNPSDIWAAILLLVTAGIVTSVAAESRRRALAAEQAAEQAAALQALAQVVIAARPHGEVLQAAATALNRIFRTPAVIFLQDGETLRVAATAGRPQITRAEEEAARGSLQDQLHTRAESYPFERSEFEFWPVKAPGGRGCILGLDFGRNGAERPPTPERLVDVVAAYLATTL